ncbi:MAG: [protein-PII] uridylyltransferase [Acidobacteriota bacterium]|jgi:[protein-PII] uridylyltransferase|nr:[protein-PII] uridylyltransferase [Acidobacteriota bacterium]
MVTSEADFLHARTHRSKVLAHATTRLAACERLSHGAEMAGLFRAFLKVEERRLSIGLRLGSTGCQTAAARSFVLDLVADAAFRAVTQPGGGAESPAASIDGYAMVAVGGYGRGELAPFSDLDILFLHSGRRAAPARGLSEGVLRLLWDTGLTIGHSFRTVAESVAATREDPHLMTSLLSTRLLAGNRGLLDSLRTVMERERRKHADQYLAAINYERDERYAKFGASVCLQEPNVKESAGSLRDLQTALWAAQVKTGCRTLEELCAGDIISQVEQKSAGRAYDFLWRVRHAAHTLSGRKTDRLALDLQPALAEEFGYESGPDLLASERFMRDYYRRARELHLFSESLLTRVQEPAGPSWRWFTRTRPGRSGETFHVADNRLWFQDESKALRNNPLLIMDAFTLAQAADVPFSQGLRDALGRGITAIDRDFRESAEIANSFLKLLRRRGRAGRTLRMMNKVGFLRRYLPEFSRISLLIQHDLYHQYTVDEHTLKAVEALDALYAANDLARAPLRAIFDEVEDPALLYLSVLLHDIGKGRGSGHIGRGAKIAERVCRRLRLDAESAAKVVLLVRLHVAMAQTAFRRDLTEPRVALDFAAEVGSLDALNMLLLLTYADLNGVGSGVWSEWKGALLRELYQKARTHLTGTNVPADEVQEFAFYKEQVVASLAGELPPSEVERHLALLPERYRRTTRPEEAAAHLRLVGKLGEDAFGWEWRRHDGASTLLTVCARDRRGLFADIAGTLAAQGVEILAAEVNTRDDGIAIDVFALRAAATGQAVEEYRYAAIERALRAAVRGESDVAAAVERWRTHNAPRRRTAPAQARRRGAPHVVCDDEASPSATLIEVRATDEPGLAYKIASALASLGLDLVCAKIATEKSDALDVFYVTDAAGAKLAEPAMRAAEAALSEQLLSHGAGRAAPVASQPLRRSG